MVVEIAESDGSHGELSESDFGENVNSHPDEFPW